MAYLATPKNTTGPSSLFFKTDGRWIYLTKMADSFCCALHFEGEYPGFKPRKTGKVKHLLYSLNNICIFNLLNILFF